MWYSYWDSNQQQLHKIVSPVKDWVSNFDTGQIASLKSSIKKHLVILYPISIPKRLTWREWDGNRGSIIEASLNKVLTKFLLTLCIKCGFSGTHFGQNTSSEGTSERFRINIPYSCHLWLTEKKINLSLISLLYTHQNILGRMFNMLQQG